MCVLVGVTAGMYWWQYPQPTFRRPESLVVRHAEIRGDGVLSCKPSVGSFNPDPPTVWHITQALLPPHTTCTRPPSRVVMAVEIGAGIRPPFRKALVSLLSPVVKVVQRKSTYPVTSPMPFLCADQLAPP